MTVLLPMIPTDYLSPSAIETFMKLLNLLRFSKDRFSLISTDILTTYIGKASGLGFLLSNFVFRFS